MPSKPTNLLKWSWLLAALLITQPLAAQEPASDDQAEPVAEQPADQPEQPAEPEAPEAEPAVEEVPADEETPAETPAAEEPADDDDKPAEETPDAETPDAETPDAETPPAEKPAEETPSESAPPAEDPAKEPADDTPAQETPAPETPVDQPEAGPPGEAAKAFNAKLDQWKALLKEMRTLQAKYQLAEEAELPAMREQWDQMVQRGRDMLPQLRDLGMAAFRESPGTDRQLNRFLVKMASDALAADRYQKAHEMGTALLEADVDEKSLLNVVGASAFVLHEYDEAEKYLKQAAQAGTIQPQWARYLTRFDEFREAWEQEQAKRAAEAEADDLPRVELNTSAGRMVVELFENEAPQTVGNFVSLVESGYYDGLTFHRVIGKFMAQAGDPNSPGPGYNIYDEVEGDDIRKHFRGSLSMANQSKPNTGSAQFFITFVPTFSLNEKHTVFGRVIEGMDVLAEIQREPGAPGKEATTIESAKVLRKRDHEYKPTKVE